MICNASQRNGKMTGTREHARDKPDFLETECLRVATTLLGYGPVEVERIARVDFGIVDQIGASKEVGVLPPIAECGRPLQRSREILHHGRNRAGNRG